MARHPLLRTCFAWEGLKRPVQIVRQRVELPWTEHDWRGTACDESSVARPRWWKKTGSEASN